MIMKNDEKLKNEKMKRIKNKLKFGLK